jgi:hypothetical protein
MTEDHSAVNALATKLGITTDKVPAKYQNELLRAVGLSKSVELEKTVIEISSHDLFLICSDGLTKMLSDEDIEAIVRLRASAPMQTVAQALIEAANNVGGRDNITVVLVKALDLSTAPTVPADQEDKEDEDRTVAAPPTRLPEQSIAVIRSSADPTAENQDGEDVLGDTPQTPPTIDGAQKTSNLLADRPLPPLVPTASTQASTIPPTSGETSISIPAAGQQPILARPTSQAGDHIHLNPNPVSINLTHTAAIDPSKRWRSSRNRAVPTMIIAMFAVLLTGTALWLTSGKKPRKAASSGFETETQVVMRKPDEFQTACAKDIANARTAFQNHDFTNALAWANAALQKASGNVEAATLQEDAQKQLELYHDAVVAANNAWKKGDSTTAGTEANQALTVYPEDPAMRALRNLAQSEITNRKNYVSDVALAATALQNHDYTNVVIWAHDALQKMPGSTEAASLQAKAQMQLDSYHAAVAAANTARQKNDFSAIVAAANRALGIYPNDQSMSALCSRAQKEIANREAYDAAIANARIALQNRDYTNTLDWANTALEKLPGSIEAGTLLKGAQKQLEVLGKFNTALANAQAELNKNSFSNALNWATEALKTIPNNAAALQLADMIRQDLAAAIANEQTYQAALQGAQAALTKNDVATAIQKAELMLRLRPNDAAAHQIYQQGQALTDLESARNLFFQGNYDAALQICQVHANRDAYNQLRQNCLAEETAWKEAKDRLQAGDYQGVNRLQAQKYGQKPPFVVLQKQAAAEYNILIGLQSLKQANDWRAVTASLTAPTNAILTNKPPFRELRQWALSLESQATNQRQWQTANENFEQMLVWFNLKRPDDPFIQTAKGKAARRVDGLIGDNYRRQYLSSIDWLETFFANNGGTNQIERVKLLENLRDTILHHE